MARPGAIIDVDELDLKGEVEEGDVTPEGKTALAMDEFLAGRRQGAAAAEGAKPAKPAKPAKQPAAKPAAAAATEPETPEVEQEEEPDATPADPDATEGDETPAEAKLDSFKAIAEHLGLEEDSFLAQVLVEAPEGPTPLKQILEGYRSMPTAVAEIDHARAKQQRYDAAQVEFDQKVKPQIERLTQLGIVLEKELGLDTEQLSKLEAAAREGDALATTAYFDAVKGHQRRREAYHQVVQALDAHRQREAAEAERKKQDEGQEQIRLLQKARPELMNREKAVAFMNGAVAFMRGKGFADHEIGMISDHRHLLIIDAAMKHEAMQAAAQEGRRRAKKVTPAPALTRPAPARTGTPRDVTNNRTAALEAHKRTGSIKSAAEAFQALEDSRAAARIN